jgi:hypothetical protein
MPLQRTKAMTASMRSAEAISARTWLWRVGSPGVGQRGEGAADEAAEVEREPVGRLGRAQGRGPRLERELAQAGGERLGDEELLEAARSARHTGP